jgi:hypothetical protein
VQVSGFDGWYTSDPAGAAAGNHNLAPGHVQRVRLRQSLLRLAFSNLSLLLCLPASDSGVPFKPATWSQMLTYAFYSKTIFSSVGKIIHFKASVVASSYAVVLLEEQQHSASPRAQTGSGRELTLESTPSKSVLLVWGKFAVV